MATRQWKSTRGWRISIGQRWSVGPYVIDLWIQGVSHLPGGAARPFRCLLPPPPSVPLPLPAAGLLEAPTLSKECGGAATLSVTKGRPLDNPGGGCPWSLPDPLFTWVSFPPPSPALNILLGLWFRGVTASAPAQPHPRASQISLPLSRAIHCSCSGDGGTGWNRALSSGVGDDRPRWLSARAKRL